VLDQRGQLLRAGPQ